MPIYLIISYIITSFLAVPKIHSSPPTKSAFASVYPDRERLASLQRMLDLAARDGLQILLLTCSLSNYSALGLHEIHL